MNRPSAIMPPEKRLPKSGNSALVAGAVVQVVLGVEFLLTGLSKGVNRRYLADFSAFVSAGSGAHHAVIAPLIQALVIPNLGVAAPALRRFTAQPERAGYVELDSGIEKYFVTSPHDDTRGIWQTYNPLTGPRALLQPLASSGSFITFVTSGLAGAFGGLVAVALGAPGLIVGLVAAACGLAFIGPSTIFGLRQFLRLKRTILFPARSPQS